MTFVPRGNPYSAFNFALFVDTALPAIGSAPAVPQGEIAGFMEASGLDGENTPIEYREGRDQSGAASGAFVRKLAGMERYPNVVLRRGLTAHRALWDWRQRVRDLAHTAGGSSNILQVAPLQIATLVRVVLRDENHIPVLTWKLQNAWLTKLSGPSLNAKSNEIAVESAELCCERIFIDLAA